MKRSPVRASGWVFGALLCVTRASALPAVETKLFDEQARKLYEKRQYRAALESFLLASSATPSAGSLYNVGITADLAGESELAFAYLGQYLALEDSDAERRQQAERRMAELRRRLALVHITSDPPGAAIYVDRRELGVFGTTPCTIPLDPGRHRIELERSGYHAGSTEVMAAAGKESTARVALRERTGEVWVRVEPAAARVTFERDGSEHATIVRPGSARWPVGNDRARAVAPSHEPVETRVLVVEGRRTEVVLVARPLPERTGGLLVSAGLVSALVLVDGHRKAETPATLPKLPLGEHRVELRAAGYQPWTRKVRIKPDEVIYLNATLRRNAR